MKNKLNSPEVQLAALQTTLDHIGSYVYTKDIDANYSYVNKMMRDLLTLPLNEILGYGVDKFYDLDKSNDIELNDQLVIQQGKTIETEEITILKNTGLTRYFWTVKKPLFDEDGSIIGLIGISTDITEQKQIEADLKDKLKHIDYALSAIKQGWYVLQIRTGEIWVSDEYAALLGYTPSELHTNLTEWPRHIHPHDRQLVKSALDACLKTGSPMTVEYRTQAKDSSWFWLRTTGEVVEWDSQQRPVRLVGIHKDITIEKNTLLRDQIRNLVLEETSLGTPLKVILNHIVDIVEQQILPSMCSILLLDPEHQTLHNGAAPSLPDFYNDAVEGVKIGYGVGSCGHAAYTGEKVYAEDINKHPYWTDYIDIATEANLAACWSTPIISSGKVLGTFAIYHRHPTSPNQRDIEFIDYLTKLAAIAIERSRTEEQLKLSARVFDVTDEGIIITDKNNITVDVNPACSSITGYSREEIIGKSPNVISSVDEESDLFNKMRQNLKQSGRWQGEIWNRKKNGERYAISLSISTMLDEQDNVINYVCTFRDITQNKLHQENMKFLAHYDALTKLPNRALLSDRFKQALAHAKRTGTSLAVCFIDLDNFKPVNDNFGHEFGDNLLVLVAQRLSSLIRAEDTLSRLGGDEFALLLGNLDSVAQCHDLLTRITQAANDKYYINDQVISISASIGVSLCPNDDLELDVLLRYADQAMYNAKQSGKNNYCLFDINSSQELVRKQRRLKEIEQALNNEEFCMFYQPKVNAKTGNVIGAEALIRWQHPKKGLLRPAEFLSIIEGTPLELKLGNWVITQGLKQLDTLHRQNLDIEISVNVSSHQILSTTFFDNLKAGLEHFPNLNPSYFQLEILESSVLSNLEQIKKVTKICSEQFKINIALDDFGTSYSSLTHLRQLPATTIKIDRSFVKDVLHDADDFTLIEGVVALARPFRKQLVAEGIETIEQGLMLTSMGCENLQGYAIAKPMPADKLASWVSNYTPNQAWKSSAQNTSPILIKKQQLTLVFNYWLDYIKQQLNETDQSLETYKNNLNKWIERLYDDHLFQATSIEQLEQNLTYFYQQTELCLAKNNQNNAVSTTVDSYLVTESYQQVLDAIKKLM